jgi:hypothetical protein
MTTRPMPATDHTAVDAAWSAAETYILAITAERRLLDILPGPEDPDRGVIEGSIVDVGRVRRRAYDRYRRLVLNLFRAGHVMESSRIIAAVDDRSRAGRSPAPIPATEEPC